MPVRARPPLRWSLTPGHGRTREPVDSFTRALLYQAYRAARDLPGTGSPPVAPTDAARKAAGLKVLDDLAAGQFQFAQGGGVTLSGSSYNGKSFTFNVSSSRGFEGIMTAAVDAVGYWQSYAYADLTDLFSAPRTSRVRVGFC